MELTKLILNILVTFLLYIAYPFVQVLMLGKKYDKQSAQKMALWNSIIVKIIVTAYTNNVGSFLPAIVYYYINSTIWIDKKGTTKKKLNSKKNLDINSTLLYVIGCVIIIILLLTLIAIE